MIPIIAARLPRRPPSGEDGLASPPASANTNASDWREPVTETSTGSRIVVHPSPSREMAPLIELAAASGTPISPIPTRPALLEHLECKQLDVVLLDWNEPATPLHELIRQLRAVSRIGLIAISSHADIVDRVLAYEFGADDCFSHMLDPREGLARVRALARRISQEGAGPPQGYEFDGWRLDLMSRTLVHETLGAVNLTSREFDALCVLLRSANRPVDRQELSDEDVAGSRAADAIVGRLRRKLVAAGAGERMIRPIRSIGYMLAANVSDLS